LKITQLSYSDNGGGAARAAFRIHQALRATGTDSTFVAHRTSGSDWTIQDERSAAIKILSKVAPRVTAVVTRLLRTENQIIHSPAVFPSGRLRTLNTSEADILHMHWVQGEMLSIADIGRLTKPLVWTLHDMWAFCGAEHTTEDFRWQDGYCKNNRPSYESGFDLNRWVWNRKRTHWLDPIQIITPSKWLAQCVRTSALMQEWPVQVIPNTLDTERWKPIEQSLARDLLGLPKDIPIILFGAIDGVRNRLKGFDLLQVAIGHLRGELKEANLVVFGQSAPRHSLDLGFPIHYAGHLFDDLSLRALYSAADVMVVPSRQEAFGQTASEAHACGTPVVAFNTCGLPDIVSHEITGYLAKPFDSEDLARGLMWVLSDRRRLSLLRTNSRERAVNLFAYEVVAKQYREVYNRVLIDNPSP
jgi:glycosyltransferase involved in cell wall biosynthesis